MLSDEPVFEAKMLKGSTPFHFSIEEEQVQLKRERTQHQPAPKQEPKKKAKSSTIFSKYFPK